MLRGRRPLQLALKNLVDASSGQLTQPIVGNMRTLRTFTSVTVVLSSRLCEGWSASHAKPNNRNGFISSKRWMVSATPDLPVVTGDAEKIEGRIVAEYPGGMIAVKLQDGDDENSTSGTSSMSGDYLGKDVVFPDGSAGVVVAHRPPIVFCLSSGKPSCQLSTPTSSNALVLNSMTKVSVSKTVKEMDCFGEPLSSNGLTAESSTEPIKRSIFSPIAKISEIALIDHPMLTGVTMLDCLAPIGRGQNMLWVGHDRANMQHLALDFLKEQLSHGTRCIYACSDGSSKLRQRMIEAGLSNDVHFVGSNRTGVEDEISRPAEAVVVASSACAIAEAYALQEGQHSLVVVDTIDMHKVFWDRTTRVLVDVFGIDSVVQMDRDGGASSEMRGFFSSLIQRSAQYNAKRGGGSVTLLLLATIPKVETDEGREFKASDFEDGSEKTKERIKLLVKRGIPLTAATLRKIDIPIPSTSEGKRRLVLQHIDDLMSMTDGQVWFDESRESRGQRPPMDPQRSVTRIGIGADTQSRADAPALRRIVEGMRLALSQASNMDGAEKTAASQKQLMREKAFLLAMHQESGSGGRKLSDSCIALLAAKEGFLDAAIGDGAIAGSESGSRLIRDLLEHVGKAGACKEIDETFDITPESRAELMSMLGSFF